MEVKNDTRQFYVSELVKPRAVQSVSIQGRQAGSEQESRESEAQLTVRGAPTLSTYRADGNAPCFYGLETRGLTTKSGQHRKLRTSSGEPLANPNSLSIQQNYRVLETAGKDMGAF